MASDEMSEFQFGEEIVVSPDADPRFRPGSKAWIVALAVPGRPLVTVEFEDGSSADVPPELIQRLIEEPE
jgi:hypothetical protein